MGIPTLERLSGGPNYVCWSWKVRFPNLQVNDLPPRCFQSLCLDEHIEGRFCSESCQSLRKFQGNSPKFAPSPLREEGHRERICGCRAPGLLTLAIPCESLETACPHAALFSSRPRRKENTSYLV